MKTLLGWTIIVAGLGLISLVLISPLYFWARRRRTPGVNLLSYLTACAVCGAALWFSIPWLVHGIFGRAAQ